MNSTRADFLRYSKKVFQLLIDHPRLTNGARWEIGNILKTSGVCFYESSEDLPVSWRVLSYAVACLNGADDEIDMYAWSRRYLLIDATDDADVRMIMRRVDDLWGAYPPPPCSPLAVS